LKNKANVSGGWSGGDLDEAPLDGLMAGTKEPKKEYTAAAVEDVSGSIR